MREYQGNGGQRWNFVDTYVIFNSGIPVRQLSSYATELMMECLSNDGKEKRDTY